MHFWVLARPSSVSSLCNNSDKQLIHSAIYFSPNSQLKCVKLGSKCRGIYEVILNKFTGEEVAGLGRNQAWSTVVHGEQKLVYCESREGVAGFRK